jgi:hypothetical protein
MKRETTAWALVCILAFLWGMNRVDLYYWKVEALESQRNAREIIRTNSIMWGRCYEIADHYWSHLAVESQALWPRRREEPTE